MSKSIEEILGLPKEDAKARESRKASLNDDGLTHKEFLFAEEYLRSGNATQASKVAYPTIATADKNGYLTLNKRHVQAYIRKRQKEKQHSTDILLEKGLIEMYKLLKNSSDDIKVKAMETILKAQEMQNKIAAKVAPKEDSTIHINITTPNGPNS